MRIKAGKTFTIELRQISRGGSPWIVRVYKKFFLFKRRVSSDWFLDGEQAKLFSEQLARELTENGTSEEIRSRHPGWTLHQASH